MGGIIANVRVVLCMRGRDYSRVNAATSKPLTPERIAER